MDTYNVTIKFERKFSIAAGSEQIAIALAKADFMEYAKSGLIDKGEIQIKSKLSKGK